MSYRCCTCDKPLGECRCVDTPVDPLEALAAAGRALLAETERVNAEIAALEKRITDAGAGVNAWVESGFNEGIQIGYQKMGGEFCLYITGKNSHTQPLLSASRSVRTAALKAAGTWFPALVAALTTEARRQVEEMLIALKSVL